MENTKNNEIKNKITCFKKLTKRSLRILARQTDLQPLAGPIDIHTSAGYTGLLVFTGCTDLQTSIGRTGLLELPGSTGLLELAARKILELTGLLELTVRTILSEFTGRIGLQTSTGRTLLLELTGHTGLLGSIVRISTGYIHKVTRNNRKYKCTRTNRPSRFI